MPQLLDKMKDHLTFVNEYLEQMRRRLAAESESTDGNAWQHLFQQTLSEHIKSVHRADPSIQQALSALPGDASSGQMVSMMQQYSDILISMVNNKIAEPKK